MCKRVLLPLPPLMAMALVMMTGCSSKPDVVLVRPAASAPFATYNGARDKESGTVYDQDGRPMRLVYSQSPAGQVVDGLPEYRDELGRLIGEDGEHLADLRQHLGCG